MEESASKPAFGLRERKKQETRSALAWAAVRLTIEHGLDNVLVEHIAAAAGVSPRTFNNYFSSKAAAIAAHHVDRLRAVALVLRRRDPEEPLWIAITEAVISQFRGDRPQKGPPNRRWADGIQATIGQPSVQAELLRGSRAAERELAAAIAERVGADPASLYPQLAAAATGAAIQVALEKWRGAHPPLEHTRLLRNALKQIANLSEPLRSRDHAGLSQVRSRVSLVRPKKGESR